MNVASSRAKVLLVGKKSPRVSPYPWADECEYVVLDEAWTESLHDNESHETFCKHMEKVLGVEQVSALEYKWVGKYGNNRFHFTTINF